MSNSHLWQGRIDEEDGAAGHRWHQRVCFNQARKPGDTVLIGYPNDHGVSANKGRTGASQGPNALRQAMAPLPYTLSGDLHDGGNSHVTTSLADTQQFFAKQAGSALNDGCHVLGLGGGHDIAWASWQALHQTFSQARIGIINFDAHLDLRRCDQVTSSGTPFRQIAEYTQQNGMSFNYACLGVSDASNTPALFDYAAQTQTRLLRDIDFSADNATRTLSSMLDDIDMLYVTVCMDTFPAASAPGVSAPAAVGISPSEVIKTIRWLGEQVRQRELAWCLSDIAELNPVYDKQAKTARLAARIAYELTGAMNR